MIKKINSVIASTAKPRLGGAASPTAPRLDTSNVSGQTALILILLTAAALIFLAITLNWGRIAQTKVLLSMAVDQSAALLASDGASYGELQKQTYLKDQNQLKANTGVFLAILVVIIAIVVAVIAIWLAPAASLFFVATVSAISVAMAVVNLVLQVVVVQPGITALWNKLQEDQPATEQFYEQGIVTALQSSVTDQVKVTDYFDSNANGIYGNSIAGFPNDSVSRFALFYTERLKMLNAQDPPIPQVVCFYDQLGEFMNGTTCYQNERDYANCPGVALNPVCSSLNASPNYCILNPLDQGCNEKIPPPNGFQLNDQCTTSNPSLNTYNPYCDPCCQPSPPSSCPGPPGNCSTNNPYNSFGSYPYLYDPSFQDYLSGVSFLDQFGRDQQMGPFSTSISPDVMTPAALIPIVVPPAVEPPAGSIPVLEFPNGVYPFFWLMDYYSPEVDNINPIAFASPQQYHWCDTRAPAPGVPTPTGFYDLAQLTLPYSCVGQDCCVNYLGSAANGVIDMVGSPAFPANPYPGNPASDGSFGEGPPGAGTWLPGDYQMCSATWPYDGNNDGLMEHGTCDWTGTTATAPLAPASPAGNMTVDSLDDTMHTLSDFVVFANTLLSKDVGTLSSSFQTWYPQLVAWIDPATGHLPPLLPNLNNWSNVMTTWLNNNYMPASPPYPWCVPPPTDPSMNVAGTPTVENNYIAANGGTWGSLPSVIACLNYNSNQITAVGSVYNYTQCLNALPMGACPGALPAACAALTLGRSLVGPNPNNFAGSCDVTIPGSFAKWVNDSVTMATNQATKFALREQFLNDIYTRAVTLQAISQGAINALQNLLNVGAQLATSATQTPVTETFPNSVIYGWQDDLPSGGSGGCVDSLGKRAGCAHIVKVTAYSTGRCGQGTTHNVCSSPGIDNLLPWIVTKTSGFLSTTRSYTLTDRDEYVYVSVKRWDEDHGTILFPNGRPLWQFLFHNPNGGFFSSGSGLIAQCDALPVVAPCVSGGNPLGYGFLDPTVTGFGVACISARDVGELSSAFMLNDNVNGTVDPHSSSGQYQACLNLANILLTGVPESHACAEYIASSPSGSSPPGSSVSSGVSQNGDFDYSVKFVDCSTLPGGYPPEDLQ